MEFFITTVESFMDYSHELLPSISMVGTENCLKQHKIANDCTSLMQTHIVKITINIESKV